jgi:hypothetical protein
MNDFEIWWHLEGSTPPLPGEDGEEHCKRMCKIAWSNGAYKMREVAAEIAREKGWHVTAAEILKVES